MLVRTHHINPRPSHRIISISRHNHDARQNDHRQHTPRHQPHRHVIPEPPPPSPPLPLPPPQPRPKLRVRHHTQHPRVHAKRQIVPAHRRLRARGVSRGVLRADARREEEDGRGRREAAEADDVEQGEVRGQAGGAAAAQVEQRLRVEGEGPGEGVEPAAELGEGVEEVGQGVGGHGCGGMGGGVDGGRVVVVLTRYRGVRGRWRAMSVLRGTPESQRRVDGGPGQSVINIYVSYPCLDDHDMSFHLKHVGRGMEGALQQDDAG